MKQSNKLEIVGVLSLSLLTTSAYAVSSCLPEMMKTLAEYDRSSLELLMSAPSFAMLLMIALTPIISKFLSERFMVVTGLIMSGIFGLVPSFIQSYPLLFASRILMGVGIGLLNTKAVSMIGERFTGDLRSKLQGIRCSMETLGQSALMLAVGFILPFGWNYAFLIYGVAFVILLMFLAFVPKRTPIAESNDGPDTSNKTSANYKLNRADGLIILKNFLLGMTFVSGQMIISLRITSYIVEYGIGTSVDGANVLSISVFFGFIGGILFGKLFEKLKSSLLPLALLLTGAGYLAIGIADNLILVTAASCLCNLSLTLGLSFMFNGVSENLPVEALNTANSMALVGCNMGATITPFIFSLIALISSELTTGYFIYAAAYIILALIIFVNHKKSQIHER